MAVYADKKNGELTGRWRVELQSGGRRYRQRHDTHKAAKEDERRVRDLWAAGLEPEGNVAVRKDPHAPTIANCIRMATGKLWRGQAQEPVAWTHMETIGAILGGDKLLEALTTLDVDRIVAELLKGHGNKPPVSEATVNRYLSHFHTFLDWCKARGLRKTAVSEIAFDWQEESEGRIRWITPEEERQLEALLPRQCWKLVKVGIETGCRRGELLGAERGQVNGNKLHLWETKTKVPRTVPMETYVRRMLLELIDEGMPTESEIRYQWDKAKAAMGLQDDEDFVFHATRHTCATRLVEAGVNLRVIQKFMGHKRIETTIRYSHVHDVMLEDAVALRKRHQDHNYQRSRWGNTPADAVGLQAA